MRPRAVASILFQSFWFMVVVAIASVGGARPLGQAARQETRPLAIDSLGATDSYVFYCAPCHGRSGKGDGPVAPSLRVRPADLSTLAERNGGTFPRERVAAYISGIGRPITAHGTSEMPVWGPAFRALDATDRRAAVRVSAIVDHLQSLQPSENGAVLYREHCARCHGATGHGGASAVSSRKAPPDLTKYAMRNGGIFPSERLAQIIDGRDAPSHIDGGMPVWGDTFRRAAKDGNDEKAKARIDALVRFLQSIQERPTE